MEMHARREEKKEAEGGLSAGEYCDTESTTKFRAKRGKTSKKRQTFHNVALQIPSYGAPYTCARVPGSYTFGQFSALFAHIVENG